MEKERNEYLGVADNFVAIGRSASMATPLGY